MHRSRSVAIIGSALLAFTLSGPAIAANPNGSSDQLIGIADDLAGKTPAQLGYTDGDVAVKMVAVRQIEALRARGVVSPLTTTSLAGYVEYHQKTQSQCLAATVQSFLHYKFGSIWTSPSVASKQSTINSSTGTSESRALSYINAKLSAGGSTFHYVPWSKNTLTTFKDAILIDIGNFAMPSETTVDVTSASYAWHQTKAANHATGVSAYYGGASVTSVNLDDPYTSPSYGYGCAVINGYPGYQSGPDTGCVYVSFDTTRLFNASEHQWF